MDIFSKALAVIEDDDEFDYGPNGGFTAILSTPSQDRDGDKLNRNEWIEPLQERYPLDVDHGMTVADTIGSFKPYFDGDTLMMRAYFSSLKNAQDVRTLVDEKHIRSVSVAFMTDKSKKDGEPRRELLNAGIVAIPSNRDAVILCSKSSRAAELVKSGVMTPDEAKAALLITDEAETKDGKEPYGDVAYADPGYQKDKQKRYPIDTAEHVRAAWSYIHQGKNASEYTPEQLDNIKSRIRAAAEKFGIKLSEKGFTAAELKAAGGDAALVQAAHDAMVHLGAICIQMVSDEDPTGADDGANKSAAEAETKSQTLELTVPDGLDLEKFKDELQRILNPQDESPADTPAEAAAEEAPADEAAVEAAEETVDPDKRARDMQMAIFAQHYI